MQSVRYAIVGLALATAAPFVEAQPADMDAAIASIGHDWARATYAGGADRGAAAFERALVETQQIASAHPDRAEPKVWEAIVLASIARVEGGFGALGKARHSRELLLEAEKIDPTVMDGSIYTTLGSLYAKVPGWPIGFGDRKAARAYLQKALQVAPDGIDANYFYGDFLVGDRDYAEAARYLERALQAPARPGREDADAGRRGEAQAMLAMLRSEHAGALAASASSSGR
jgi:tetratricopeptide (TPR) repeat protein